MVDSGAIGVVRLLGWVTATVVVDAEEESIVTVGEGIFTAQKEWSFIFVVSSKVVGNPEKLVGCLTVE